MSFLPRRKSLGVISLVLLASFLAPAPCWAQVVTANLYGTVQDPTGALIPGAEVTLRNEGTGNVRQRVSGETASSCSNCSL